MSLQDPAFPLPWEHSIKMRTTIVQDPAFSFENYDPVNPSVAQIQIEAYCTCLQYTQNWSGDTEALQIAEHASDHLAKHPSEPLAVCQMGDESFIIVMAVPGPRDEDPVHMSIAVSKETFLDGRALMKHLGPIGSSLHFHLDRQQRFHGAHGHEVTVQHIDLSQMPGGIRSLLEQLHRHPRADEPEGTAP